MGASLRSGRWLTIAGLLLLCLLWASDSLCGDLLPPSFARTSAPFGWLAVQFGIVALGAAFAGLSCRAEWPGRRWGLRCALVGLGLFFVPALLLHLAAGRISELTRVALFSLAPVFAVVLEPYLGGSEAQSKSRLIAALTAVAGTLCVFPFDLPGSVAAGGAFCAVIVAALCIAAANCEAVFLATELPGASFAAMIAIVSGTAAAGYAATSTLIESAAWAWNPQRLVNIPELAWTAAVELPAFLILFWLMRRMSAVQMTTRFLFAPLITNLVGLAILQPKVGLRAGIGLVLIAVGAVWILFAPAGKPEDDDLPETLHLG